MRTPLKLGMVGGGTDAFIGAVHRRAATLDGEALIVAGALSSTPERALASGRALGLDPRRTYPTWREMLAGESALPHGERIDLVSIVTPNHVHFDVARAFLEAGFHVVCDKPLVHTSAQAEVLAGLVARTGRILGVTYNYTGYPLVIRARELVAQGALGTIRKVFVEYHQGWLATPLDRAGQKQALWRADPAQAGAGALGDIGTHAENLASFVGGLEIDSLCADVTSFVPDRRVDDDAAVLIRFKGGAKGVLTCSQVCVGCENSLSIRVHGTTGSLAWRQEDPNVLELRAMDAPLQLITRAGDQAGRVANSLSRLPPGHPEGFHEAFANVYRGIFAAIRGEPGPAFPGIVEGARGVRFIERALASARAGGAWVAF